MYTYLQVYNILTNKNGSQETIQPSSQSANSLEKTEREKNPSQDMLGRPQLSFLKNNNTNNKIKIGKSSSSQGPWATNTVEERRKRAIECMLI